MKVSPAGTRRPTWRSVLKGLNGANDLEMTPHKKIAAHQKLPLLDDPSVREVFASELVNVTAAADTVTITLCTSRTTMDGPELKVQRVVSARLVVPADTALNISNRIQQLLRQKQLLEAAKSSKPM